MQLERRAFKGLELREAPKGSAYIAVLTGIAAPFNKDSLPLTEGKKNFIERIAPGAFTRTLREKPDVVGLWSHDNNKPLARTPHTLTLTETAVGLAFEMRLVNTTTNQDLVSNVRSKIIDGVSFGFEAVKTRWEPGKEVDTRVLLDVDLFEISPTVWPAYPDTGVAERSLRQFREIRSESPELREIIQERDNFLRRSVGGAEGEDAQRDNLFRNLRIEEQEIRMRLLCLKVGMAWRPNL